MMDDETFEAAKDKLQQAIKEYYATVEPDVYVDDWALVVHKDSIALTAQNQSAVGTLVPTQQPFHRTAGLLEIASYRNQQN